MVRGLEVLVITLGAVAFAMCADLASFALVVPLVGIGAESNPLMARTYLLLGLYGVAFLKVACTVAILALVIRVQRREYRRIAAGIGIAVGLVGFAGNLAAVWRA